MHSGSYTLRFEERDGYLFAEVSADTIDVEMAKRYLEDVAARCSETAATRLMLVRNIPVMLAAGSLYYMTKDFQAAFGDTKVAFVNPYATIEKQMEFAILMGNNIGATFRLFTESADAEKWLIA